MTASHAPHSLMGKHVLLILICFFAAVFAANGIFLYSALSTRPGEEEGASYETGLHYNLKLAAARAQNELGWRHRVSHQDGKLSISFQDASGMPVDRLILQARLVRPATEQGGTAVEFKPVGPGVYEAPLAASAGNWILSIEARGGPNKAVVYRAKERLWVPEARS
ncbi:MAG TPA: FixH family protein [Hyphomicrobiales bacterium]|nr:FixH family protein [Hyphomicrobiales bacterium]